jgi:single-strand DNA-binding protein
MRVNEAIVGGRITTDPEIRYTAENNAVCNFSVAIDPWKEGAETDFIDCTAWGKVAETMGAWVNKGARVIVTGWLQQNRWQDRDGKQRSKILINARNVTIIDWPEKAKGTVPEAGPSTTPKSKDDWDSSIPF